jgi:hypothetical protein
MANVQGPVDAAAPSTPQALIAAAGALVPLVGTLNAKGDPASLTAAAQLKRGINQTLDEAMSINAASVVTLLRGDAAAQAGLTKLTAQAQSAAAKIANDEAQVQSAISFCASVVSFGVAVTTGNVAGAATALGSMLTNLKIT